MARPRNPVPTYKKHPTKNEARCWVGGQWISLGPWNDPKSQLEYERICAEVRAAGQAAIATSRDKVTTAEVFTAFMRHAHEHYRRRDGSATNELSEYRQTIKLARELYGHVPATEFGPLALQAVRNKMIEKDWCRKVINKRVSRLRRVFKWAVGQELVEPAVWQGLVCVQGLQKNRTAARETEAVKPVGDDAIAATLPHLTPTVRAMVNLQRLTGMRPGEVRLLVPADIVVEAGDAWVYRPAVHKMAHLGRDKAVPIGPKARELLAPLLANLQPDEHVFSPARARDERYAMRRAKRKTPVQPSQANRKRPAEDLERVPRDHYEDHIYTAAIMRACKAAGVPHWHPNQIRHTFASEVRRLYGLEAAQVLLGHARADVTQVYAERDWGLAVRVAGEIG